MHDHAFRLHQVPVLSPLAGLATGVAPKPLPLAVGVVGCVAGQSAGPGAGELGAGIRTRARGRGGGLGAAAPIPAVSEETAMTTVTMGTGGMHCDGRAGRPRQTSAQAAGHGGFTMTARHA